MVSRTAGLFRMIVAIFESLLQQCQNLSPLRFTWNPRDLERKEENPTKISIEKVP